ncbi:MAG: hypothetical protein IJ189_03765 [Clostridia bacterium]|nr:hypothetical protein [Clostridia bacterium]
MKEQDMGRAAMSAEEAALLPALPRRGIAGKIALRERIEAAERMDKMRLSNEMHTMAGTIEKEVAAARRDARAALHHILRK